MPKHILGCFNEIVNVSAPINRLKIFISRQLRGEEECFKIVVIFYRHLLARLLCLQLFHIVFPVMIHFASHVSK